MANDIVKLIWDLASDYPYGRRVTEEEALTVCRYIAGSFKRGTPESFPHGFWGDHAKDWADRTLARPSGASIMNTARCAAQGVREHYVSGECDAHGCHSLRPSSR